MLPSCMSTSILGLSRQLAVFHALKPATLHFSSPGSALQFHRRVLSKSFSSRTLRPGLDGISASNLRKSIFPTLYKFVGVAGVGIGLSLFVTPKLFCEPVTSSDGTPLATPPPPAPAQAPPPLPPPSSSVSYYELTFGTVCGICAGVFVKKGAKALAFVFGGVFVLLQYLGSQSLVRVDWGRAAGRFENLFYTKDAGGAKRPPNLRSLFRWIVDFLTADFQQRASFIAGFALGLRMG